MTIEEIARQVAVGIAVVVVVFCAACVAVVLLVMMVELAGWVERQRAFRALQCRVRGHGWITVTVGQIGVSKSYTRHRVCGYCGRREEVT